MKKTFFLLLFVFIASIAFSAPNPSSIDSGTFSDGETIVISGTGFGTKSPATPLRWDDFDDYATSSSYDSQEGSGGFFANNPLTISNTYTRYTGDKSARQNYTGNINNGVGVTGTSIGTNTTLYYHAYYLFDRQGTGECTNFKLLNIGENRSLSGSDWASRIDCHERTATCSSSLDECLINLRSDGVNIDDENKYGSANDDLIGIDEDWHRIDGDFYLGTQGGGGCTRKVYVDNSLLASLGPSDIWKVGHGDIDYLYFGHYWAYSCSGPDMYRYYSEIYVDITKARVEVGNASTLSNCTHREIQIPSAWATDEISFTVHQGEFDSEDTLYVYVWDEDGSVNSSGLLIEEAGGDTTAPTVTAFTIPETADSTTISITTFTATDDTAVTGYCVNESATPPTSGACSGSGWEGSAQTSYTFSSQGEKTLYGWAKDEAGNISDSLNDSVTVTVAPRLTGVHGSFTY